MLRAKVDDSTYASMKPSTNDPQLWDGINRNGKRGRPRNIRVAAKLQWEASEHGGGDMEPVPNNKQTLIIADFTRIYQGLVGMVESKDEEKEALHNVY